MQPVNIASRGILGLYEDVDDRTPWQIGIEDGVCRKVDAGSDTVGRLAIARRILKPRPDLNSLADVLPLADHTGGAVLDLPATLALGAITPLLASNIYAHELRGNWDNWGDFGQGH